MGRAASARICISSSWSKFWESSFLKQILQDYKQSNGLKKFEVRWVFDARIGDVEAGETDDERRSG